MIFAFADHELDTDRIEVRHQGVAQHVEPQVFDVLRYLIEHRDRMVPKTELLDEIWGGNFVGESALTSRVKSARQLVGDSGRAQRIIRTVHGRGYQFVADVVERDGRGVSSAAGPAQDSVAGTDTPVVDPLPSGTVTFLFSDIEGSSRLWEEHAEPMAVALARHDHLLQGAIERHGGVVFATAGDGMAAAFVRATSAIASAREIRSLLDEESWPEPIVLRVRLGVHTGEAVERDGDYLGPAVNRAARVMAAAHGGQTLISDVTAAIVAGDPGRGELPTEPVEDSTPGSAQPRLIDLGLCRIDPAMPSMRLWQLDGPTFPPLTGAVVPGLPSLRTDLVGRHDDLERVVEAVGRHRLVSLVGPGGAGKTTLALAAGRSAMASFPAGVVFAELASVGDAAGIQRAVAEAAGVDGSIAGDLHALVAHLAPRPMLLVLDNCEHLLDDCADLVDLLLDARSEIRILVTTRESLGMDGELVVPLGSLDEHAPELFVERARTASARSDLRVDDPRIIDLCRRLDGLPLAIELAAAQLRHLSIDELVDRLGESLDLSRGGRTRGRGRHVTLERTIGWSHDLLDAEGQRLLRQFGVFPGGFDLAAAEAVGGREGPPSVLPTLSDLVAKSLLICDADTGRYRLLETIRAFASRRLEEAGEADAARERLRRHIVERSTGRSRVDRWFSGGAAAVQRADLDNVRFAFDRSMWVGRPLDALEILLSCTYLFRNTMQCSDGRRWIDRLRPAADDFQPEDRLWFTLAQADVAQGTADHGLGVRAAEQASELVEAAETVEPVIIARHLVALHAVVADPLLAGERLHEALEQARTSSEPRLAPLMRSFASVAALSAGDIENGMIMAEEVASEVEGDGYEVFIAHWAAWTACLVGEDAERLRFWIERQRRYLAQFDTAEPWMFLWSAGLVAAMEGGDATESLRAARERADGEGHDIAADIVLALAVVDRLEGRPDDAAELLGVVMGRRLNNMSHYVLARTLRSALRDQLGREPAAAAMARGAQCDLDEILDRRGLAL